MSVIAIASELASDGASIARQVAGRLGLSFLDHTHVLERLAQHGFTLSEFKDIQEGKRIPAEKCWQLHKIGKIISSEILFLAQKSSMMLHSPYAPYLLAGVSHIPRIHVRAPKLMRAKSLADANQCDETQAMASIRRHDERETFILENFFGVKSPGRAEHFDLVADTGWLTVPDWVEQIIDLAQDPDFEVTHRSRNKLSELAAKTVETGARHFIGTKAACHTSSF